MPVLPSQRKTSHAEAVADKALDYLDVSGTLASGSSSPDGSRPLIAMQTQTHVFRIAKQEKRRKGVQAACNTCRTRKLACDGQRPHCRRCQKRGDLDCTYDTQRAEETRMQAMRREMDSMKAKLDDISKTLTALKDLPSEGASQLIVDVLHKPDPTTSLIDIGKKIQMQSSNLSQQLSILENMKASFPNTKSSVQFELYLYFPKWYPPLVESRSEMANSGPIDLQEWQAARRRHLSTSPQLSPAIAKHLHKLHDNKVQDSFQISSWNLWIRIPCLKFWTTVPISVSLAERAFNAYLHSDHVLFGFMDTELFLRDFAECRSKFCSTALVNACLYYACMKIARCDLEAAAVLTKFQTETERALDDDEDDACVAKLAALNIYYTAAVFHGPFDHAKTFLDKAVALCDVLYGWESPSPQCEALCATPEDERGLSQIVWSVCTSAVYMTHRWANKAPPPTPRLPIPFLEPATRSEINLPSSPAADIERIVGERYIRAAICVNLPFVRESVILHLLEKPKSEEEHAAKVASIYRRALENAAEIGRPPSLSAETTDIAAISQMWSHFWILSLFQPLTHYHGPIPGFQASGGTAGSIFVASARQLQHLVFLYQRYHSLSPPTLAYHGPIFVAAVALTQIRTISFRTLKFEALLWLFADLAISFPGIRGLMQSLALTGYEAGFVELDNMRMLYDKFSDMCKVDTKELFKTPLELRPKDQDDNRVVAAALRESSYDQHFATTHVIGQLEEEDSG